MSSTHNINHLKTLLLFVFSLGDVTAQVLEDGKFEWQEGLSYIPPLTQLPNIVQSLPELPKELADLEASEREELIVFVKEKFDLENDALEQLIEAAFEFLVDTYGHILVLKELVTGLPRKTTD